MQNSPSDFLLLQGGVKWLCFGHEELDTFNKGKLSYEPYLLHVLFAYRAISDVVVVILIAFLICCKPDAVNNVVVPSQF